MFQRQQASPCNSPGRRGRAKFLQGLTANVKCVREAIGKCFHGESFQPGAAALATAAATLLQQARMAPCPVGRYCRPNSMIQVISFSPLACNAIIEFSLKLLRSWGCAALVGRLLVGRSLAKSQVWRKHLQGVPARQKKRPVAGKPDLPYCLWIILYICRSNVSNAVW